jgi:hypothetical protein
LHEIDSRGILPTFPSFPKSGVRDPQKMSRSHLNHPGCAAKELGHFINGAATLLGKETFAQVGETLL